MNRRRFLQGAAGAPLLLFQKSERRPNILLVMTDQQSWDALSCRLGRKYLNTPNMDSLPATGAFIRRAYCANPLCVPSRTSMFTGRYPPETGVLTNDTTPIDPRQFPTLATLFKQAGYITAYFGKWHLPYREARPQTHGFDLVNPGKLKGDAAVAAAASSYLRERPREPFLMAASFVNPQNICQWARGEPLPDGEIGQPPPEQCPPLRANHVPQKDEPDIMSLMRRSYQSSRMFPVGNFDAGKWRQYIWAYYRMIEKMDGLIGQVLGALRSAGLEQRTVVVFLADHGDCQGAHGWNQKTVFYEEAARVPFIISYISVTRSLVSDRLVHTGVDLIPTLCDFAGLPKPDGLPGLSLYDTVLGKKGPDPRTYLVVCNKMVQGAPLDGRVPMPEGRMVRSQRYKYCVYSEGQRRESLMDLEQDSGEMVNLARDPVMRRCWYATAPCSGSG
ncbi:MAG: sulfatase family protein [Bryobacteraceae bacterium]